MRASGVLVYLAVAAVVAAVAAGASAAEGKSAAARFEDLYLGDFSLDPESDNRKTPASGEAEGGAVQQKLQVSYPSCITLCSSQKRAIRRQELSVRKQKGAARIAGVGKTSNIHVLEAKERAIKERLKELRRQKRAAAHAAHHRKLLMVENTEVDEERAERLAKFAQTDKDQGEARKIQRLLQERKKLLGYLTPSKLATKSEDDSFQKRLGSLPFSVAGETDCVASCKKARSSSRRQSAKKAVKTHMLPTSDDPPMVYQGGHDDCDAGGMMIMPPDFPVRVVNKGDCATCSAVCSTMKFSSPWMRDRRGSCGVRAESDTLDRYMRNFNGEVTMNLCTPLKGLYGSVRPHICACVCLYLAVLLRLRETIQGTLDAMTMFPFDIICLKLSRVARCLARCCCWFRHQGTVTS